MKRIPSARSTNSQALISTRALARRSNSWASPTEPLPVIRDPRVAFEKLFGVGGSTEERFARRQSRRSILDWVAGEMISLKGSLGADDRTRLDRYLEDIREVERRIQAIEARNTSGEARALPDAPAGVPDSFQDHMRLMFDLQVLALETDMTRIISFKTGRDAQNRAFPEGGVNLPFHPTSHHGGDPEKLEKLAKINNYHISLFAYYLEKLKNTPDGDGSLLDHTLIMYGSGMGNSSIHSHQDLPILVLGGGAGKMKGGRHVKYTERTPLANLHLTLLDKAGIRMDKFQDSKGKIDEILAL